MKTIEQKICKKNFELCHLAECENHAKFMKYEDSVELIKKEIDKKERELRLLLCRKHVEDAIKIINEANNLLTNTVTGISADELMHIFEPLSKKQGEALKDITDYPQNAHRKEILKETDNKMPKYDNPPPPPEKNKPEFECEITIRREPNPYTYSLIFYYNEIRHAYNMHNVKSIKNAINKLNKIKLNDKQFSKESFDSILFYLKQIKKAL